MEQISSNSPLGDTDSNLSNISEIHTIELLSWGAIRVTDQKGKVRELDSNQTGSFI